MADTCPPECQVTLKSLGDQINELKETDKKQWEVFDQKIHECEGKVFDRVKTKTLIALFGVVVTLFLAIMALTFNTLHSGQKEAVKQMRSGQEKVQEQMGAIERQMVKVATQLEGHTSDDHDRDTNR